MGPAPDRVQGFMSENKRRRRHRKTFLAWRMPTLCMNRDLRIVRAGGAPCIVDSTVIPQIIIFSRRRRFRAEHYNSLIRSMYDRAYSFVIISDTNLTAC